MLIKNVFFLFLICLAPLLVFSGELYGTIKIKEGNKITTGVTLRVEIKFDRDPVIATTSNRYGLYRFKTNRTGRYSLTVSYKGVKIRSIYVYSYTKPVRCNLLIEKINDGYILKRV